MVINNLVRCPVCDIFHKTKEAAQLCIDRNIAAEKRKSQKKWTNESYKKVFLAFQSGKSPSDIADQEGVSLNRIYQVLKEAKRLNLAAINNPFETLSVRARSCLRAENFPDTDAIRLAMDSGTLRNVQNLGMRSHAEIRFWLDGLNGVNFPIN